MRILQTQKGATISRHNPVGKKVGDKHYFHQSYALAMLEENIWSAVQRTAKDNGFDFNCVMLDSKTGKIRLDEAPGFDTEREPVVGRTMTFDPAGGSPPKMSSNKAIWHHKWLWVQDTYTGFDVEESYKWSATWLAVFKEAAKGQSIKAWNTQLDKYSLPHDGDKRDSMSIVAARMMDNVRFGEDPAGKIQTLRDSTPEMVIEQWEAKDILPYFRNPRDNSSAIQEVAASLKRFGWQQPIVVDTKGVIIVGHTRYQAALSMGWTSFPVQVARNLTEAEVTEYRLTDNKVAEAATWNKELLRLEIQDLQSVSDLDIIGFKDNELAELFKPEEDPTPRKQDSEYGGATALSRGSVPLRYWREQGLLQGDVLDYGCGKEEHDFARFDIDMPVDPLLTRYDTIMCNYVLNVQPTDHLIDLILANLYHMAKESVLIAVVAEASLSGSAACGNRAHKTPREWQQILSRFFIVEPITASFCGFVCRRGA